MNWLCVTSKNYWEVIKKNSIWAMRTKHSASKASLGDNLLIYLKRELGKDETIPPRIVAVYEVTSEVFKDVSILREFPYKVRLRPTKIPKQPLNFKRLVPNLSFIKNKQNWGADLRGKAMIKVPEKDFEMIMELME